MKENIQRKIKICL